MRSALLIIGFLVTFGVGSASAQTSSQLQFTWSPTGTLNAKVTYNRRPDRGCVFRLRAAVSGERQTQVDAVGPVVTRRAPSKRRRLSRVQNIEVSGLPGVGAFSTGDPVLTLQAKMTCGSRTIVSNAVARYVKCGRNVPKVSASKFLEVLKERAR